MPKVKAQKKVKKEVWNTYTRIICDWCDSHCLQVRLGKSGWQRRSLCLLFPPPGIKRPVIKMRGGTWPVPSQKGLDAFELAKTFKGGA